MRRLRHLVVSCLLLSGCFGPGEGVEVPLEQIYFPVGLAMAPLTSDPSDPGASPKSHYLFVASSDFDLQYNGGAVQSYDLNALATRELPTLCASDADCGGERCDLGMCTIAGGSPCRQGDRSAADRLLYPGRCNSIDPNDVKTDSVKIGAFATDAVLRTDASGDERLFVPVRGDSTLHWLDVDENGKLECGQIGNDGCDAAHRAGDDPGENSRDLTLGPEPFAIDATPHAENVVVTNQTTGTVALFTSDVWADGPKLKFALASDRIPQRPAGVVALPPARVEEGQSSFTFMMTFRDSAQVRLFRYAPDSSSNPSRDYLVDGGGVAIDANSVGSDSRGIAIDSSARDDAEQACATGDADCLSQAALVPLDVYVANRAPSSLLIGRTQPPQQFPYFFQTVPLTTGPSRVVVGRIKTGDDSYETRVFVVCFESRRIFIYDPKRSRMETEIFTGRGPYAVAVDKERSLLYVGHFTDSYIGVFSLDLARPDTYGTMIGTLGEPKAPRSSK